MAVIVRLFVFVGMGPGDHALRRGEGVWGVGLIAHTC